MNFGCVHGLGGVCVCVCVCARKKKRQRAHVVCNLDGWDVTQCVLALMFSPPAVAGAQEPQSPCKGMSCTRSSVASASCVI